MMKKNEENKGVTFFFVIQSFSFILSIGGLFALLMVWSISCSTKKSGAYERYDAMEAEISSITLPEKTILQTTHKGVRSTWVHVTKVYKTDYPYNKIIADCRQQLKLRGWKELRKKIDHNNTATYFFKRKDWKLEFSTSRHREENSPSYTPLYYTYYINIEWRK